MRRWAFWLFVAIFFIFFIRNAGQIEDVATVLLAGKLIWLGSAFILQAAYYLLYTRLYQSAFNVLDLNFDFHDILPFVLASLAINVAAPTGGTASTLLFMDHATRKGQSAGKAAAGTIIVYVSHLGILAVIIAMTLSYLSSLGMLEEYQLIATALFLLFVFFFISLLWVAMRFPRFFNRVFKWLRHVVNAIGRMLKKDEIVAEDWIDTNAHGFTEAAHAINRHTNRLQAPIISALLMHLVNIASLYMVFLAFGVSISFGILLVSYAMSQLFMVVSPTPQGIGVVEGIMAIVIGSFGIAGSAAAVVALAYRGLAFWIPLAIGAILLRMLHSFKHHPVPVEPNAE